MGKQESLFPDRSEVGLTPIRSRSQKDSPIISSRRSSGDWWDASKERVSRGSTQETTYDCSTCGLSKNCRNPKIKRYGRGKKGILLVDICPGKDEDRYGVPFVGESGQMLRRNLIKLGIDIDEDCVRTNVVACFKDEDPTTEQIKACSKNLLQDIHEVQPKLIIAFGDIAINAVLIKPKACGFSGSFYAGMMHGLVIPSKEFGCCVGSSYHPAFYIRRKNDPKVPDDENLLLFDIASALSYLEQPLPHPLTEEGNHLLSDVDEIIAKIESFTDIKDPVAYDYETTCLTPWEKKAQIVSIAFCSNVDSAYFIPLNFINPATFRPFFTENEVFRIKEAWKKFLLSNTSKIVQNLNMEGSWDRIHLGVRTNNVLHDTMLGSHVLHCRKNTASLAFQVYLMTGHDYKEMVNTHNIMASKLENLFHYNCWDSRYTLMAYYYQKPRLEIEGRLKEFNDFLVKGEEVLLGLQCRGILIDSKELKALEKKFGEELERRVSEMKRCPGVVKYEEDKKAEFNPESSPQFASILRNHYKVIPTKENKLPTTKTGRLCTDEDALPLIMDNVGNLEVKNLIKSLLRFRKCGSILKRAKNYWQNMDSENKVHPAFYLLTDTFRSSAESPSIQNVYKHDKELMGFRKIVIPSPGRILLEVDESGLEVRVVAMASGDEELIRQIINGIDTHRKWASEIFEKPGKEITYDERYEAKNGFVFKSFYGGTPDAMPRYSDLFSKVSKKHFAYVQEKFWNEYKGVKRWQNRTIETYKKLGYIEAVSGFRRYGPLNINKIYNTPIQGPGFHLCLNSLIHLDYDVNSLLAKNGFKSHPLFEVHDSITFDALASEAEDLVKLVSEAMICNWFDWQRNVPMGVDWEIGKNWFELKSLVFRSCPACGKTSAPQGKETIKLENGTKEEHFECGYCQNKEKILVGVK